MVSSCVRPCILGNAGHISSAWQEVCQLHHFIIIALMTSSVWLHGFLSAFAWCQSATVYTQHALFGPHYLLPLELELTMHTHISPHTTLTSSLSHSGLFCP